MSTKHLSYFALSASLLCCYISAETYGWQTTYQKLVVESVSNDGEETREMYV